MDIPTTRGPAVSQEWKGALVWLLTPLPRTCMFMGLASGGGETLLLVRPGRQHALNAGATVLSCCPKRLPLSMMGLVRCSLRESGLQHHCGGGTSHDLAVTTSSLTPSS